MRSELDERLTQMALVVQNFALGSLSARDFERQYADFYYYEALDGHEPYSALPSRELSRLRYVIELHRRVQLEVVNNLAFDAGFSSDDMRLAGRLTEPEAMQVALRICADVGMQAVLDSCYCD